PTTLKPPIARVAYRNSRRAAYLERTSPLSHLRPAAVRGTGQEAEDSGNGDRVRAAEAAVLNNSSSFEPGALWIVVQDRRIRLRSALLGTIAMELLFHLHEADQMLMSRVVVRFAMSMDNDGQARNRGHYRDDVHRQLPREHVAEWAEQG